MTDLPAGFVVTVDPGHRIHFQDWGDPGGSGRPGVVLVHGLSQTSWIWAPVARRLAADLHTVAMDLRGHGLSDAPSEPGAYDLAALAEDVVAVAEGAGVLDVTAAGARVVLAGHGFGAVVATAAAAELGDRCAGLVLVDGGWERPDDVTGMDVDEFLRGLAEPPEVMASMGAFLRDRRAFDPATWDADQERAARATVVETRAGRLVPTTGAAALEGSVRTMFETDPIAGLAVVDAPVVAILAGDDGAGSRLEALDRASAARVAGRRASIASVLTTAPGHNVMRYRPAEVTAAIRSLASPAGPIG